MVNRHVDFAADHDAGVDEGVQRFAYTAAGGILDGDDAQVTVPLADLFEDGADVRQGLVFDAWPNFSMAAVWLKPARPQKPDPQRPLAEMSRSSAAPDAQRLVGQRALVGAGDPLKDLLLAVRSVDRLVRLVLEFSHLDNDVGVR